MVASHENIAAFEVQMARGVRFDSREQEATMEDAILPPTKRSSSGSFWAWAMALCNLVLLLIILILCAVLLTKYGKSLCQSLVIFKTPQ